VSDHSIEYYNRYTKQIETEAVYGEPFLKFLYNNPIGRLCLKGFVRRHLPSNLYGKLMDSRLSKRKILPFIEKYKVDTTEFQKAPAEFTCFNDFFIRKLKPEARPINEDAHAIVFPADGRHYCIPDLSSYDGILVKGNVLPLVDLLGSLQLAETYLSGSMVISRLCPTDYHRFHFPITGHVSTPKLINGYLYSVNPIALRKNIHIFAQNKRFVTTIKVPSGKEIVMIEVGATCVGSVSHTYTPNTQCVKGAEKGFFSFGGSTVITVFPKGSIEFENDLLEQSAHKREVFAKMGDKMGSFLLKNTE